MKKILMLLLTIIGLNTSLNAAYPYLCTGYPYLLHEKHRSYRITTTDSSDPLYGTASWETENVVYSYYDHLVKTSVSTHKYTRNFDFSTSLTEGRKGDIYQRKWQPRWDANQHLIGFFVFDKLTYINNDGASVVVHDWAPISNSTPLPEVPDQVGILQTEGGSVDPVTDVAICIRTTISELKTYSAMDPSTNWRIKWFGYSPENRIVPFNFFTKNLDYSSTRLEFDVQPVQNLYDTLTQTFTPVAFFDQD